jgi:hypothetical protein
MATVATTDRSQAPAPSRTQSGSPISWTPNHELDAHEWAAAGHRIGAVGRCIQWLLGDWIAYGNTKFGERYARASKITGYDAQTLMNMVYVASRFPISRRRENLSWSHHETLASLEPEDQDQWLDEAGKHRWSVSDLRMMLRAARKGGADADGEETGDEHTADSSDSPAASVRQSRIRPSNGSARNGSSGAGRHAAPSSGEAVTCPHCGEQVPLASR